MEKSKESVTILVLQESPKSKGEENKNIDNNINKNKRKCVCDGVGKPFTCGLVTLLGYAKYVIGVLILISIVAVVITILFT